MDLEQLPQSTINPFLLRTSKSPLTRCRAITPCFTTLNFLDFLPELQHVVFDHLDPVTSVCLGLTCKTLYAIHRAHHGRVPLTLCYGPSHVDCLAKLLVEWMGPRLRFSGKSCIFVCLERREEERMRFGGSYKLEALRFREYTPMPIVYDISPWAMSHQDEE